MGYLCNMSLTFFAAIQRKMCVFQKVFLNPIFRQYETRNESDNSDRVYQDIYTCPHKFKPGYDKLRWCC